MTRHRLASAAVALATLTAACGSKGGGLERLPFAGAGPVAKASAALATRDGAMAPAMYGRVEYRVQGALPGFAESATAYKLVADPIADPAVVKMASAFGLKGPVQRTKSTVVVRDGDRALSIQLGTGSLPWSLHHVCANVPVEDVADQGITIGCAVSGSAVISGSGVMTRDAGGSGGGAASSAGNEGQPTESSTPPTPPDSAPNQPKTSGGPGSSGSGTATPAPDGPAVQPPMMCAQALDSAVSSSGSAAASSGTARSGSASGSVPPTPCPVPARPADLPSQADAQRIALAAVRAAGLDASGEVRVDDEFSSWRISIEPKVHGVPTINMTTAVSVGPRGVITDGSGFLGRPDGLGSYPLVGAAAGLDRLRRGTSIGPRALATQGAPTQADPAVGAPIERGVPAPGTQEPAPTDIAEPDHVIVRNVTGVHLALMLFADRLVPAYVFELDGGPATVPVPAVVDRLLVQPAIDKGVPRPLPPIDKGPAQPLPEPTKPTR